jgi:hypothetical protein
MFPFRTSLFSDLKKSSAEYHFTDSSLHCLIQCKIIRTLNKVMASFCINILRAGFGFAAPRMPQTFGRPSELNYTIILFLLNRVFNANFFFTTLRMFHAYFPRQIKKFPSNPQFLPPIKFYQNNLHATAALRNWPPVCTHAQHACQNRPWSQYVIRVISLLLIHLSSNFIEFKSAKSLLPLPYFLC